MLLFFSDTTDGKHNCVCGVHHMEYLLTADRLGRNFCEKGRDLCSAGRFLWSRGADLSHITKFRLQTQIMRRAWKRETLQQS